MARQDEVLAQWLQQLGLGMYLQAFASNDISWDVLRSLSDADLRELGLSLGHRRILLAALNGMHTLAGGAAGPVRAERRHVTVMFVDLVGSTALSSQLDLDDLYEALHDYYAVCSRTIEAAGGFVARIVGDGVLAYFGYPVAREDAAECGIRAALAIRQALARPPAPGRAHAKVRIGLASGVSAIGDIVGGSFAERHSATGLTPNVAARIHALAEPGSILVADDTRRLAGGVFGYEDLGLHQLRGVARQIHVWKVLGEGPARERFSARRGVIHECLGRAAELDAIARAAARVRAGQCHVVTVVGEAGIGKSRLLHAAAVQTPGHHVLLQCAPTQASAPLYPIIDWIRRAAGVSDGHAEGSLAALARWLGDEATDLEVGLVAELVGTPAHGRYALPAELPQDRRGALTRELLLRHVERRSATGPVLLLLEDAHWLDGVTEDFVRALLRRMADRPLLLIVSARPHRPQDWPEGVSQTGIRLEPLQPEHAIGLVRQVCRGRRLPPEVLRLIVEKTDGVPLFVEELTATILESGALREAEGELVLDGALPALAIPATLHDSLAARLDRLGEEAKAVARIASAIGRSFGLPLLVHVCGLPEDEVRRALGRLVDAQLLFEQGAPPHASYVFKHALVQQAAYDSQLRHDRQALHARIVQAIETWHPETAGREPGLMAHHCQEAQLTDKQVDYLHAAGCASTRMVAIREALAYFGKAEQLLAALPPSPRNASRRIDAILGLMDVGRFAFLPQRLVELGQLARSLSQSEGVHCDAERLSTILFQEGRALLYSSQYAQAGTVFAEIRRLGRAAGSPRIERKPGSALAMALCCQGLFGASLDFLHADNVGAYKSAGSLIDYIAGLGWIGYAACETGQGEAALRFGDRSVQEALQLQSPIYEGGARVWRSHALMALRRLDEAVADARRCVDISRDHAVPYLGWHALVFLALCLCRAGRLDEAEHALQQAGELLQRVAQGHWSLLDYVPAIEAEILCCRRRYAEAGAAAERAIALAGSVGGHFAEAMAWRVKAVASVAQGQDPAQGQAFFDRAAQLHARGDAQAELAFSTLVWAHALQQAGHGRAAQRQAADALQRARRHGFVLERCEYGAAAVLAPGRSGASGLA
ncbi:AAA family ATPase [Pseudorhodoferax sp.]|uniref:AAA family ATPase n=1 Tax=Pseudorhodoferax sp. TaxID=1993553 RepID=UPI0039E30B0F